MANQRFYDTTLDQVNVKKTTTETIGTDAFANYFSALKNADYFGDTASIGGKKGTVSLPKKGILYPCYLPDDTTGNCVIDGSAVYNPIYTFPFFGALPGQSSQKNYGEFLDYFPRLFPALLSSYDYITNSLENETSQLIYAWELRLKVNPPSYNYPNGWEWTLLGGISELFSAYPQGKVLNGYEIYTNTTDDKPQRQLSSAYRSPNGGVISRADLYGTCMAYTITSSSGSQNTYLAHYMSSIFQPGPTLSVGTSNIGETVRAALGGWLATGTDFHLIVISTSNVAPSANPYNRGVTQFGEESEGRLSVPLGGSGTSAKLASFIVADEEHWNRFFNGSGMPWSYDLTVVKSATKNGKPDERLHQPDVLPDPGQPDNPVNPPGTGDGDNISDKIEYPDPTFVPNGAYYRYWLSAEDIPNLRNFLFDQTFIDDVRRLWSDPINYIVDITYYPLIPSAINAVGGSQKISIGGVQSEIVAEIMPGNSKPYLFGGYYDVKGYYGNYLDYEPYTSLSIFLPYIGTRELDVSRVTGHRIGVWYLFDFDSRIITAQLVLDGGDGSSRSGTVYCDFSAPFGITFPLSGSSMNERALAIVNSITSTAVVAGGVVAGAAIPAMSPTITTGQLTALAGAGTLLAGHSLMQSSHNMVSPKMGGTMSPMSGLFGPQIPYLIINRPITSLPSTYNNDHGLSAAYSGKVSDFASDSFLRCSDVILDVAPDMTVDEQNEIISLLQSGVYI